MIVMGVDPGQKTGVAFIKIEEFDKLSYLTDQVLELKNLEHNSIKLFAESLKELISQYRPSLLVWEDGFVGLNPRSSLKLGLVRGLILGIASGFDIVNRPVSPTAVKKFFTGYGMATKEDIINFVKLFFKIQPKDNNSADAIAIACAGGMWSEY